MIAFYDATRHPQNVLTCRSNTTAKSKSTSPHDSYSSAVSSETQVRLGEIAQKSAPTKHPAQRKRKAKVSDCQYQHQQTSLFVAATRLTIEPVPTTLAVATDRYYLTITEGDRRWQFPVQWTEAEARRLFPQLQKFDWGLAEGECYPDLIPVIYEFVESLLDGNPVEREAAS